MKTPEEVANRPVRSCACLEGNDGFCPIHGSITRDPDELLHDARMMEAEMKEERAPLTEKELEEIRDELADWNAPNITMATADIASLLAEVERLRGVLNEIGNATGRGAAPSVFNFRVIARAALEGK